MTPVRTEARDDVLVVTIDRPEVRNAVDRPTADALSEAFRSFDADDGLAVAILTGAEGNFCAGADLKAFAEDPTRASRAEPEGDGPMGPSRMLLSKPVIAAIEGHAVAGGLELAVWCDLRVAAEDAVLGVFNRRWGVPLLDGGTVRLTRLIGQSHALDLILTGREVRAQEAREMGLVNRITKPRAALQEALALARDIARFPQQVLRADRRSVHLQWGLGPDDALAQEFELGLTAAATGEALQGAQRFASGKGRHGNFDDI